MGLGVAARMDRRWRGKALAAAQDPATAELPRGHERSPALFLSLLLLLTTAVVRCALVPVAPAVGVRVSGRSVVPELNDRAPAVSSYSMVNVPCRTDMVCAGCRANSRDGWVVVVGAREGERT